MVNERGMRDWWIIVVSISFSCSDGSVAMGGEETGKEVVGCLARAASGSFVEAGRRCAFSCSATRR